MHLEGIFVAFLQLFESGIDVCREVGAADHNGVLGAVVEEPFSPGLLIVTQHCSLEFCTERAAHRLHHVLQPHLHWAIADAVLVKCHILTFTCSINLLQAKSQSEAPKAYKLGVSMIPLGKEDACCPHTQEKMPW